MLNFGTAKQVLAQYCGAGKFPGDPTIGDDINQAVERLMNKPKNWTYLTVALSLCAPNGQVTLPREVAKILKARLNGEYADVQSRWYEYLSNGPGLLDGQLETGWIQPLIDRGFACTQYDIPEDTPMYLAVISDRAEDDNAKILIRGHDETGREIHGSVAWGEYVPIKGRTQDQLWITEAKFSDIISIEKPVTNGYVYLSAILPADGIRFFLGSIHPDETQPHYRRYFCHEVQKECRRVRKIGRLDAICRLQYVPCTHDSDILTIQNTGALKMMLKAIRMEDAEKIDESVKYEMNAVRLMGEQTDMLENDESMIDITMGFGIGPVDRV